MMTTAGKPDWQTGENGTRTVPGKLSARSPYYDTFWGVFLVDSVRRPTTSPAPIAMSVAQRMDHKSVWHLCGTSV